MHLLDDASHPIILMIKTTMHSGRGDSPLALCAMHGSTNLSSNVSKRGPKRHCSYATRPRPSKPDHAQQPIVCGAGSPCSYTHMRGLGASPPHTHPGYITWLWLMTDHSALSNWRASDTLCWTSTTIASHSWYEAACTTSARH
jgi:hypothetical protein